MLQEEEGAKEEEAHHARRQLRVGLSGSCVGLGVVCGGRALTGLSNTNYTAIGIDFFLVARPSPSHQAFAGTWSWRLRFVGMYVLEA